MEKEQMGQVEERLPHPFSEVVFVCTEGRLEDWEYGPVYPEPDQVIDLGGEG